MIIETERPPYLEWLLGADAAWLNWLVGIIVVLVSGLLVTLIFLIARRGPRDGFDRFVSGIASTFSDLLRTSPRRVLALTRLSVLESIRRLVLVAFVVFVVVLLFAGWYLDTGSSDPAKLYLEFVMTATSYLVLLLALFLSVFSLPSDIAKKTIHTVVTKPVRTSEVVIGRVFGFTLVGTVMLAFTGLSSYFFVTRGLTHTHEILVDQLEDIETRDQGEENPIVKKGRTTQVRNHRHEVYIRADGTGVTDIVQGHWHEVQSREEGSATIYELGPPQGMLTAKVPIYGKLSFTDRLGNVKEEGINVGNEWTYRGYFEGGTRASARWLFDDLRPERFPEGLPVEFTVSIVRTHKGEITRGVRGAIDLVNPQNPSRRVQVQVFEAKEYDVNKIYIPRVLRNPDPAGEPIDVFEDLVADGQLIVQLRCVEPGQYMGAAQPDLYLRATDASFKLNFVKGYAGIWLQMLLVVSLGVMFSTFLNAPVAMLATVAAIIFAFFSGFVVDLAENEVIGGGPVESLYRIVMQKNLTAPLEEGVAKSFVETCDMVIRPVLQAIGSLLPDLRSFSDVNYVASGFNIPADNLAHHVTVAFAYALPVVIAGFIFLKFREVAR